MQVPIKNSKSKPKVVEKEVSPEKVPEKSRKGVPTKITKEVIKKSTKVIYGKRV